MLGILKLLLLTICHLDNFGLITAISYAIPHKPYFTNTFSVSEPLKAMTSLSLRCSATGLPLPRMVWTLDGQPIGSESRTRVGDYVTSDGVINSFVNISQIRTRDGGVYSCNASNSEGSVAHKARVDVLGPVWVRPMPNITANSGHTVHIDCPYTGYPIESIDWFKLIDQQNKGNSDSNQNLVKLPENQRQKCVSNGTLIISAVNPSEDQHWYRCSVSGEHPYPSSAMTTVSSDVFLQVLVSPLISPIAVPQVLREGMRVVLTCAVIEGSPPIHIEWRKDGIPLNTLPSDRMRIVSNTHFSQTVIIENISSEESGSYECIAHNMAGSDRHSIGLSVKVSPKWVHSPQDTQVIRGRDVVLDCVVSPLSSRVWWERQDSHTRDTYRVLVSNSHMHSLENGSLNIKEVTEEDEGVYACRASTGLQGQDISKLVAIKVLVPAHFTQPFSTQTAVKGSSVTIECNALGEKPISVVVLKDLVQLNTNDKYRVMTDHKTEKKTITTITIKECDRRDSALYTCVASNRFGSSEHKHQLIVQSVPDPPSDVILSDIQSNSILISFALTYSGNTAITSYEVQYRPLHTSDWQTITRSVSDSSLISHSHRITGLKAFTSYELRIRVQNTIGLSAFSAIVSAITGEDMPSAPPQHVRVYQTSAHSLHITFSAPNSESTNGPLKGYYVAYKPIDTQFEERFVYKKFNINDITTKDNTIDVTLNHLKRETKYQIFVQAFNSAGSSPQSDAVIGETLANDPPKAPSLSVLNVDFESIEINWTLDSSQNSDIESVNGFYVYSKSESNEWQEREITSGQRFSYLFTGLECGTLYQFYIIAYNEVGKGDPSNAIAVRTLGSGPTAPKSVDQFVSVNTTSAKISLNQWLPNGCSIMSFDIRYKAMIGTNEWTQVKTDLWPEVNTIDIMALSAGLWYSLWITARTERHSTENTYHFATLNEFGEMLSPLDQSSEDHSIPGHTQPIDSASLLMIVPTTCSVVVLTAIAMIACFVLKKRLIFNHVTQHSDHSCDDQIFQLSVLPNNTPKESPIPIDVPSLDTNTDKELYFQSPYAFSRLHSTPQQINRSLNTCLAMALDNNTNTDERLRDRDRDQHIYQMPNNPKWV